VRRHFTTVYPLSTILVEHIQCFITTSATANDSFSILFSALRARSYNIA
jgi:hypothetical protein